MPDKRSDLGGPGMSTYEAVHRVLPQDCESLPDRKTTQNAIYDVNDGCPHETRAADYDVCEKHNICVLKQNSPMPWNGPVQGRSK